MDNTKVQAPWAQLWMFFLGAGAAEDVRREERRDADDESSFTSLVFCDSM